jgi:hypothetical protein
MDTAHQQVEGRFVCDTQQVIDQVSSRIILRAATTGRDNTDWAPFTPAGTIDMIVNGTAGHAFSAGKRYRVLIQEVPDGE